MKEAVYQYDNKGFYLGETVAYNGLMPHGTTKIKPQYEDGFIACWNGQSWEQIENHRGEKGFVDNISFEIKEYGAYPHGWSKEYVKSLEEVRAQSFEKVKEIDKTKREEHFQINELSLPKKHAHIFEWLVFAKYKAMGKFSEEAIIIDSLGYNMNEFSPDFIENSMFELLQEINVINTQKKENLEEVQACESIEKLEELMLKLSE